MAELEVVEGFVPFHPNNEVSSLCQTHYKRISRAGINSLSPVLIIVHGGPTWGHEYMLPLQQLVQKSEIGCAIFYDQIGCGKSTRLPDKDGDRSFWNLDLFRRELDNLVQHLSSIIPGVPQEQIKHDVLGHSTGALIAALYAGNRPQGLRNLVLSNGLANWKTFVDSNMKILSNYPPHVRNAIVEMEEFNLGRRDDCKISSDEYLAALNEYRKDYCLRTPPPPPQGLVSAFENIQDAMKVFATLAGGQVEMIWGGSLINEDATPALPNITVPTLVINGEHDKATPMCSQPFCDLIPCVKYVVLENTSHLPQYEDLEKYIDIVSRFLSRSLK